MLCSSCSKYGDSFSASFEEFSYFLPSPLAGSLFLFKLLGTFPPSSLLKCARNSCYLSNWLHAFRAFGFKNGEAIEDQGIQESKTKIKITSFALKSMELFSEINLEKKIDKYFYHSIF